MRGKRLLPASEEGLSQPSLCKPLKVESRQAPPGGFFLYDRIRSLRLARLDKRREFRE
jgi:hypothetical protein